MRALTARCNLKHLSQRSKSYYKLKRIEESIKGPPATSYTPYDDRKGAGYGTTDPQFDIQYKKGSVYPYVEPPSTDIDKNNVEDEVFSGDPVLMDKFVRMINKNFVRTDPSRRADRASFVSNQRVRIPESSIGIRKGDSLHGTISPIPKKSLYGSFDGPAIGGSSSNFAFNPGPLKRTGTQYGTSHAPLHLGTHEDDPSDDIHAYTLEDILYPDIKAVAKARISTNKQKNKSNDDL